MDTKKKKIEAILSGTASPVETLRYLEGLSEADIDRYLPEDEFKKGMTEYRSTHNISEPAFDVSDTEKEALWQKIKSTGNTEKSPGFIKNAIQYLFSGDTLVIKRFSPVMVCLIILIIIPAVLFHPDSPDKQPYSGIKGEKELYGAVQYAIMDIDGTLERPDRKLTEADTLAFRINVNQKGYFSLFFVYNNTVDTLFIDQLFEKGVYDLETIYQLNGNYGKNSMILLSGRLPLEEGVHIDELILNAKKNNLSLITVNDENYRLVMESIRVEKAE